MTDGYPLLLTETFALSLFTRHHTYCGTLVFLNIGKENCYYFLYRRRGIKITFIRVDPSTCRCTLFIQCLCLRWGINVDLFNERKTSPASMYLKISNMSSLYIFRYETKRVVQGVVNTLRESDGTFDSPELKSSLLAQHCWVTEETSKFISTANSKTYVPLASMLSCAVRRTINRYWIQWFEIMNKSIRWFSVK